MSSAPAIGSSVADNGTRDMDGVMLPGGTTESSPDLTGFLSYLRTPVKRRANTLGIVIVDDTMRRAITA